MVYVNTTNTIGLCIVDNNGKGEMIIIRSGPNGVEKQSVNNQSDIITHPPKE